MREEYSEFELDSSIFSNPHPVGSGRFGASQVVTSSKDLGSGNQYIQQVFRLDDISADNQKYFLRLIEFFFKIPPHPCLHKFYGHTQEPQASIILQYHEHRLSQIIEAQKLEKQGKLDTFRALKSLYSQFTNTCRAKAVYGLIAGLFQIHNFNTFHRAVQPNNVFLNEKLEVIIGEFGFAKDAEEDQKTQTQNLAYYQAPEILNGADYDYKIDVYAVAMIIYELLTKNQPFNGITNPMKLEKMVLTGKQKPDTIELPADIAEVLQKSWEFDKDERCSTFSLLSFFYRRHQPLLDDVDEQEYREYVEKVTEALNLGEDEMRQLNCPLSTEESQEQFQQTLRQANETGDPSLLREVGRMYFHGVGTDINFEQAIDFYTSAAEKGDADSMFHLSQIYQNGIGIDQNTELAAQYSQQASEAGNKFAKIEYGVRLLNGNGVTQDPEQALALFKELADPPQSDITAMYYYGMALLFPPKNQTTGTPFFPSDPARGLEYLTKSANKDYMPAKMQHAEILLQGLFGIPADVPQALRIFQQGATQNVPLSLCKIGLFYEKGAFPEYPKDLQKAIDHYRLAIKGGCKEAMTRYAIYLAQGINGILEKDKITAAEYYKRAADKGDKVACHNYASFLVEGIGRSDPDIPLAIEYFKRAQHPRSYFKLGELYLRGEGIDPDFEEARKYLSLGARMGDAKCQAKLREMDS